MEDEIDSVVFRQKTKYQPFRDSHYKRTSIVKAATDLDTKLLKKIIEKRKVHVPELNYALKNAAKNFTYNTHIEEYKEIISLLVDAKADIDYFTMKEDHLLYNAIETKNSERLIFLLEKGAEIIEYFDHSTPLHICAEKNWCEGLSLLNRYTNHNKLKENVNKRNSDGESALHIAAKKGCCVCVEKLINWGGDLALKNNLGQSAFYFVRHNISQPIVFLCGIMDKRIKRSDHGKDSSIDLDFGILVPYYKHKQTKQMDVLINILELTNSQQTDEFLNHPLVVTFLRLKWDRIRTIYYFIIVIYLLFVVLLSSFILLSINNDNNLITFGIRWITSILAGISLLISIIQFSIQRITFLMIYENYVHVAAGILALIVTVGTTIPLQKWILHVSSYAVLLAWLNLMLYIGRLPKFGYYALLLGSVFKQICKVLAIFVCVIFGFTISFSIQFHDLYHFQNPWNSFVKTFVMMLGEFEYSDMFPLENNKSSRPNNGRVSDAILGLEGTSRILFLIFVIVSSITMINLMVGLSVNDVQSLIQEGRTLQLIKKAYFLMHYERMPKYICKIRLRPRSIDVVKNINKHRNVGLSFWKLPLKLYDSLLERAEKQLTKTPSIDDNIYDWIDNVQENLNKIKNYLEYHKF